MKGNRRFCTVFGMMTLTSGKNRQLMKLKSMSYHNMKYWLILSLFIIILFNDLFDNLLWPFLDRLTIFWVEQHASSNPLYVSVSEMPPKYSLLIYSALYPSLNSMRPLRWVSSKSFSLIHSQKTALTLIDESFRTWAMPAAVISVRRKGDDSKTTWVM